MEEGLEEVGADHTARNRSRGQWHNPRRPSTRQASTQTARRTKESRELHASASPYRACGTSKVSIRKKGARNSDGAMRLRRWRRNSQAYGTILHKRNRATAEPTDERETRLRTAYRDRKRSEAASRVDDPLWKAKPVLIG